MSENPNFSSLAQQGVARGLREKQLALAVRSAIETVATFFGSWNQVDEKFLKIFNEAKAGTAGALSHWPSLGIQKHADTLAAKGEIYDTSTTSAPPETLKIAA